MLLVAVATDLLDRFIISEILTFLYTYSWIVEFILWPFMVAELYYICTEVCVGRNDVVHGVRNKEEQFRRSRRCFVELFPGDPSTHHYTAVAVHRPKVVVVARRRLFGR